MGNKGFQGKLTLPKTGDRLKRGTPKDPGWVRVENLAITMSCPNDEKIPKNTQNSPGAIYDSMALGDLGYINPLGQWRPQEHAYCVKP